MHKISLTATARDELEGAEGASNGRSSRSVYGGHDRALKQTVIALCLGQRLAEHANPGDATVQVLQGRVLLSSGEESATGWLGDLLPVPDAPHTLEALEDSVILLTTVRHR